MSALLDEIVNLPKRFVLNDVGPERPPEERTKLDDSLYGFTLQLYMNSRKEGGLHDRERKASCTVRVCENYFEKIILILTFILDELQEHRQGRGTGWPMSYRVSLDLDKLLIDTRGMLDAIYCLTLLYQPDAQRISKSKQASFGSFADWYDPDKLGGFTAPLGLLVDAIPWGQDIRRLRDGYVHHGHTSFIFRGETELYIDPFFHRMGPKKRVLPDCFYLADNPNNLILVEKFLAFIIAPVLAIRRTIGDTLIPIVEALPGWRNPGVGSPYKEGPGIYRMQEWLLRNTDVLDPATFQTQHFKKAPSLLED